MITDCKSKAYSEIRQKLITGEFVAGQRISDYKFAKELNIGRGYVREAISQMASEGLLRQIPNRGAFVPEYSLEEIREAVEVREVLDGLAAYLATKKISLIQIEELTRYVELQKKIFNEALTHEVEESKVIPMANIISDTDVSFHMKILEFSGNSQLYDMGSVIYLKSLLDSRSHSRADLTHYGIALSHQTILDAIKSHDPERARHEASNHVRVLCNGIDKRIREHLSNEYSSSSSVAKSIDELEEMSRSI